MALLRLAAMAAVACSACSLQARVVINEISYHPPNDNDALEFIELHNTGDAAVDLQGWKFTKGIKYEFTKKTEIAPKGFLVLGRDAAAFKKQYGIDPGGVFSSSLKNTGENIELSDAQGKRVDKVNYKDDAPWPRSADGESATLERISPDAEGNEAPNWASSPLSTDPEKPAGTPGKQNANYLAVLPPTISGVAFEPRQPTPSQGVNISATVRDAKDLQAVELVFQVTGGGAVKEGRLPMKAGAEGKFTASIPAQPENSVVRFRVEAANKSGSRRLEPGANEPLPAYSYFVHEKFGPAKVARGFIIHVDEADLKKAQKLKPSGGQGMGGMNEAEQERFMARMNFDQATEFSPLWMDLVVTQQLAHAQLGKLREVAQKQVEVRKAGLEKIDESDEPMKESQELTAAFQTKLEEGLNAALNEKQRTALSSWKEEKKQPRGRETPEKALQRLINLEAAFMYVSTRAELSEAGFNQLKEVYGRWNGEQNKLVPEVKNAMEGRGQQNDQGNLIERVQKLKADAEKDFAAVLPDEPARQAFVAWREETNPFQMRPGRGGGKESTPARGKNAFVYVPPEGGAPELYDFVEVKQRGAGYKVHFAKGHPLRQMTTANIIYEYNDRFVLAEALAYEVYRRAGNAAPKTEFIRLQMDGRPFGYHLVVEQPNRAFLKRNKIRDDGNLYKLLWYERGAERQHEKKTNPQSGHDDLLALLEQLEKTKGDEQWEVIKKNFNVEQVINYFAVNMVLSHWDGYFNNYFTYHDVNGTGKWEMYPWDQDKTWGFHDGLGDRVFFDMPVTFGMEGDVPPGHPKNRPPPQGFNGGAWWRPGGFFSKPLLANPEFRKQFLARTKEILEKVYTEKEFFPLIDGLNEQLSEEVRARATVMNQKPEEAIAQFERNLESLKEHLRKRREFLLAQDEIKNAGKVQRTALR